MLTVYCNVVTVFAVGAQFDNFFTVLITPRISVKRYYQELIECRLLLLKLEPIDIVQNQNANHEKVLLTADVKNSKNGYYSKVERLLSYITYFIFDKSRYQ